MIVLVALGNGIQAGFTEQFSALTNQIQIVPVEDDRSAQPLTDADVEALGKRTLAPDVTSVTPVVSGSALLQQQGEPATASRSPARPPTTPTSPTSSW